MEQCGLSAFSENLEKGFIGEAAKINVLYVIEFAALRLHFALGLLKSWPSKMLEILKS